jgi:hypothetical protein
LSVRHRGVLRKRGSTVVRARRRRAPPDSRLIRLRPADAALERCDCHSLSARARRQASRSPYRSKASSTASRSVSPIG